MKLKNKTFPEEYLLEDRIIKWKYVDEAIKKLIEWGKSRQTDNTIYSLSTDELNEDWIKKLEELIKK